MLVLANVKITEMNISLNLNDTLSDNDNKLILDTVTIVDTEQKHNILFDRLMGNIKNNYIKTDLSKLWFIMNIYYLDYNDSLPILYPTTVGACHYYRYKLNKNNELETR